MEKELIQRYSTTGLEENAILEIRAYDHLVKNRSIRKGHTGQLITFEASTNCSNDTYQWEFGDGTKATSLFAYNKAIHKFEEAGEYEVALTVYNKFKSRAKTVKMNMKVEDTKFKSVINNWKVISFALATVGAAVNSWESILEYAAVP